MYPVKPWRSAQSRRRATLDALGWEIQRGGIAKPNFHSRSVFSENLVAIEMRKLEMKFDKSIYVGMCILDISKTCLYEFHHAYMSPLYHEKCKIMYTDTDSFIYRVRRCI